MEKIKLFYFLLIFPLILAAQSKTITGKVLSENNLPLPGASVLVKGLNVGASTDFDGNFSLNVPKESVTLVISYVGYISQEIPIGNNNEFNINLLIDSNTLDEVVVVGYTSVSSKNLSSSVSQLSSKEVKGLVVADVKQAIQGKIAGVQVVTNNGDPSAGSSIVIRGMGSFTSSEPLYVIDGIQGGDINSIPQSAIKSVTVLKDAATTAIYGAAGANGVIIITTRSGKEGAISVEYDGSSGLASVSKRLNALGAVDYIDLVKDIQETNGLTLTPKLESADVLVNRTDWEEEAFRTGLVMDHNLNVSGGSKDINYVFSTGYQYLESSLIDRDFERLNLGVKLTERLFNNRVRLGQSIRFKDQTTQGVKAGLANALRLPPYMSIYDDDKVGGFSSTIKTEDLQDSQNIFNNVYNADSESTSTSLNIELFGEIDIFDVLMFRTQARIAHSNSNSNTFNYPSEGPLGLNAAQMKESFSKYSSLFLENYLSYANIFGVHRITGTLGMSYAPSANYRSLSGAGSDFTTDAVQNISLANTKDITGASVNSGKSRLSYFASAGYTFDSKYIFNASFRRDASSVFGEENKWGNFYGLSGAWTISNEDFFSDNSTISFLKLRGSYGVTGNDNIPGGLTDASVWKGSANNIVYSFGDGTDYSIGSTINSVPNPLLKWEETKQFDVGFDIGLFNNRLDIVLDYYKRNNDDLLIQTVLPLTAGLGLPGQNGTQWINAASMENNGFEFSATYRNDSSKDFKWNVSFNTSYNENEVTDLGTIGDSPILAGEFVGGVGNATRTDIGHAIGSFYGYKIDHVAVNQGEVNQLNQQAVDASGGDVTEYIVGLKPGDFIFKDIDGNGYVDSEDRTYIGNPSPKFQYGFTFNGEYKGFDIQLFLQGVSGVDVVNGNKHSLQGMSKPFNQTIEVLDRWRNEGDVASLPRAGQNSGTNLAFSDWYVENGAYLRLKNIALGYTFSENLFNNTFNKARVYVAVQNAFTITNYSGYDPEISTYSSGSGTFARGIDFFNQPNPTIYRIGVQLNF